MQAAAVVVMGACSGVPELEDCEERLAPSEMGISLEQQH